MIFKYAEPPAGRDQRTRLDLDVWDGHSELRDTCVSISTASPKGCRPSSVPARISLGPRHRERRRFSHGAAWVLNAGPAYTTALHVLGPEAGIAFANAHDLAALLLGRAERGFVEHVLLAANRMLA
ncbi:MAG: hypothetical protein KA153_05145 [Hyphomonadaceae bacterium]|nr:hypothetical protein [Hyphomonadaceae bacterium]